jgi:glucokinase
MNNSVIGIDLGGTNIRGGLIEGKTLSSITSQKIKVDGTIEDVLQQVFALTDSIINSAVTAIGIGVPGLADEQGIVYDVLNIPCWKEVPLKKLMEERYQLPVFINNDANCFALGEFHFGSGQGKNDMVGLTIGTGLGTGIILNKQLYAGANGGAGEFGTIDYLDKCYEYYCSGQYFSNVYGVDGEVIFMNAEAGNEDAIEMFKEMGFHLGNAIKTIMYALDVELIVIGGSVKVAYKYFEEKMWKQIKTSSFQKSVNRLQIVVSELPNSGILGAASLCYNH